MENRKDVAVAGARKKVNRLEREIIRLEALEGDQAEAIGKVQGRLDEAKAKLKTLRGS